MLTLIILDGDFNLPQNLLIYFTDRCAEGGDGLRGVKVKNAEEIFMLKVVLRLQSAPGHQRIGDAYGSGVSECHSDVEIIILLKKRIFNDVKNIALMVVPVFVGELRGDALQLIGKTVAAGNIIIALQHGGYGVVVLRAVFPQIDAAGIVPAAGVGYVKYIAQAGLIAGGVDDRDTF